MQSVTLALMSARGALPPIDCAIFADTAWEPQAVYDQLALLKCVVPYPIYVVSGGNLRADLMTRAQGLRAASAPWFTLSPRGKRGMARRQCTKEYKLQPIRRKVVELLDGKHPARGCELWIGISTDEAHRQKPSQVKYINNRFPLIEREMSRRDCLSWLATNGWPTPAKSSCIGCPYHSDSQWRSLSPAEFADAVDVDRAIRAQPGMRGQQFMHRSLKPLDEVDFSTAEERGQMTLFGNECEGMCGV